MLKYINDVYINHLNTVSLSFLVDVSPNFTNRVSMHHSIYGRLLIELFTTVPFAIDSQTQYNKLKQSIWD